MTRMMLTGRFALAAAALLVPALVGCDATTPLSPTGELATTLQTFVTDWVHHLLAAWLL